MAQSGTAQPQEAHQQKQPQKTLKAKIAGMTCASCEVLIERKLRKLPGISGVHVSHARGEAELTCTTEPSIQELNDALKEQGYAVTALEDNEAGTYETGRQETNEPGPAAKTGNSSTLISRKKELVEIGKVFFIIVALFIILRRLDIIPGFGISEGMGYGIVFLIGLVAAVSTCMAVTGGLLLALSAKYRERYPNLTGIQRFRPHLFFNIGRIASYTLLGAAVGALGSVLTLSPRLTGIITIIASVAMVVIGLQMLRIFPFLSRLSLKMPKALAHRVYDSHGNQHPLAPFLFGAATFFFPCGFTQALQLYVLSTGSALTGGLTMLIFSLGTLPGLLSIGALSSALRGAWQRDFLRAAAVIVVLLGVFNIGNGLTLAGASVALGSTLTGGGTGAGGSVALANGVQVVEMSVRSLDYEPAEFTITQGIPVEWRIDGRGAVGCAQVLSVPSLGITEYLPPDSIKTIRFTPNKPGTITFSCSMGMAGPGRFIVVPGKKNTDTGVQLAAAENDNLLPASGEVQRLQMEVSRERGFFPNSFTVKKGIPVELEIDAKIQLGGCMGTLLVPKYNVAHAIPLGKSTLRFTPTKAGVVPFTCSMGSRMGEFVVV